MTAAVEATAATGRPTAAMATRRYAIAFVGVVVLALAVRVAYVLAVTRYLNDRFYDAFYYIGQSAVLANGGGFQTPVVGGANALHPPLTALVVTPATWLVGIGNGAVPQRITMAVVGTLAVAAIGWLGTVVAGRRVGLIAAFLAAVYPNLVMPSGIVMSESLAALFTALVLVLTYRLLRAPTWVNAALLGLGCGAAALTRSELIVYVPVLLVPAVLAARAVPWRARLALAAVGFVVAGVTVAPWVVRNLATFQDPTFLSTGDGGLLLGANCDATYHGDLLGAWSLPCSLGFQPSHDPSVESSRQDRQAITYMRHHLGRLPVVVAARVGRLWEVYQPFQTARFDEGEGRPVEAS
ncbi:MAG TPA: glycosyltransferase family 39 protein, partial [Acidimicrobiia bacterium]|nr:glycosyltransferase family 39 protein [Acidimicrobiia bacterium]